VFDETDWKQETTIIKPGDTLVLYTDGVTEAQNAQMQSFGKEQLLASARAHLGKSAGKLLDTLLEDIHKFVGDAPKSDDITLMVIVRG
jgi:sigma-B regulation protein RsbU (phosphoserine phosphatase)